MTRQEINHFTMAIDRFTAKITKDRATARAWLLDNGFVTQDDIDQADGKQAQRTAALIRALEEQ